MTKRLKCEFDEYVCDILNNEHFLETKKIYIMVQVNTSTL